MIDRNPSSATLPTRRRRQFFAAGGKLMEATTNIHAAADRFVYTLRLGAEQEG